VGKHLDYLLPKGAGVWFEALMGIYALGLLLFAISLGNWGLVFWLSLISGGYAYITIISIKQSMEVKLTSSSSSVNKVFSVSTQATSSNPGQD
jgi:hypothetical protein